MLALGVRFFSKKLTIFLVFAGAVAGAAYSQFAKPVFESVASVVLYRDRVENPNSVSEDAKNRWVWIRDGLTLTEGLLSDDFLSATVMKDSELAARYGAFRDKLLRRHVLDRGDDSLALFVQRLRKEIRIDYTGGDSNTFIFTVRDRSPIVAKNLAQEVVNRLRNVWVNGLQEIYSESLVAIEREIPKAEPEGASPKSRSYLKNTYNGLLVASRLNDVVSARSFQLVRKPFFPIKPLWPRRGALVPLGAFVGLLLGLFLCFLREQAREPR